MNLQHPEMHYSLPPGVAKLYGTMLIKNNRDGAPKGVFEKHGSGPALAKRGMESHVKWLEWKGNWKID